MYTDSDSLSPGVWYIYKDTNKFMNMMEKGITRETIKGDYMKTQMFTEYVSSVS